MRTNPQPPAAQPDQPTLAVVDIAGTWRVHVTWSDGAEGPVIAFASLRDAQLWIARDCGAWLERLAALGSC